MKVYMSNAVFNAMLNAANSTTIEHDDSGTAVGCYFPSMRLYIRVNSIIRKQHYYHEVSK
jgi:hypothetical protein